MEQTTKQTLELSIDIDAPKEKIWDVMLQDKTYRIWTSVFHEGSYAEGDWSEGSIVYFKSPEGSGLESKVVVHKPADTISFEHLRAVVNDKPDDQHKETQNWAGMRETYRVKGEGGISTLMIEQDIMPEYADWFQQTWEKALAKIKDLSEG